MSTTTQPLTYLWTAYFEDSTLLNQPADDHYSKHDPEAEWNPSAFRDILDYEKTSPLLRFMLGDRWLVDLDRGLFGVKRPQKTDYTLLSLEETPLTDRKLIFFREMRKEYIDGIEQEPYVNRYCMGYEGKNSEGKVEKKVIYVT